MASATEALKQQAGLQKKPISILEKLESMKPQIAMALPRHLTPERMVRIAITCLRTNPKLAECDAQSVLASVMLASQLGLEPGVLGQCFLVPYKDHKTKQMVCTLVPGWLGILDLVNRAGKATAWTGEVYAGDHFEWALGDKPFVTHRPCGDETTLTHVYAIARTKGSEYPIIEVWPIEKVWKHRERFNKVGDAHYSYKHFPLYARKVALLQALKYVPRSVELATAFRLDAEAEMGEQKLEIKDVQGIIEGTVVSDVTVPEEQTETTKESLPELCADCRQIGSHHKLCKHNKQAPPEAQANQDSEPEAEAPHSTPNAPEATAEPRQGGITAKQVSRLFAIAKTANKPESDIRQYIKESYGLDHINQLNKAQYDHVCTWAEDF
jgi:recombination protein RecT